MFPESKVPVGPSWAPCRPHKPWSGLFMLDHISTVSRLACCFYCSSWHASLARLLGITHGICVRKVIRKRRNWNCTDLMVLLLSAIPLDFSLRWKLYAIAMPRARTKFIRRKHVIQPTGFGAYSSTCFWWDGEDVPVPWEELKFPSSRSSPKTII